jgi:phage terminase large subunit-like protein
MGPTWIRRRTDVDRGPLRVAGGMATRKCPLRVISGHTDKLAPCPLYTQSRTWGGSGTSYLGFKSYDQGRRKFQGTGKHVIWLDEEPPADVYDECLLRLMTTNGLMLCTFTPLLGLSDVAMRYLPELAPEST